MIHFLCDPLRMPLTTVGLKILCNQDFTKVSTKVTQRNTIY